MLTDDNPKARLAQAPVKTAPCHAGCGSTIHYRTSPRIICEECKPARRAEQLRLIAERRRRKNGVAQVKGTVIPCQRCGTDFERDGIRAKFCAPCAEEEPRKRARERVNRLCRERGAPQIGEELTCKHCAATFNRTAPREAYCPSCKELQRSGNLPSLKKWRTQYWHTVLKPKHSTDPTFKAKARRQGAESRERRKKDPAFTINERMSAGIRYSLNGGKNGSSWESLVGYTCSDLVTHLERQFLPGMTWENRSKWEIDHIVPVSSFKFDTPDDPEFKAAWAITNLRPLWRELNNEKRAKRLYLL